MARISRRSRRCSLDRVPILRQRRTLVYEWLRLRVVSCFGTVRVRLVSIVRVRRSALRLRRRLLRGGNRDRSAKESQNCNSRPHVTLVRSVPMMRGEPQKL